MPLPDTTSAFFYLSGPAKSGWIEQVAVNPGTVPDIATAAANAIGLATTRLAWLTADCSLDKIMLRGFGLKRQTYRPTWTAADGTLTGSVNLIEDMLRVPLFSAGGTHLRQYDAHGILDSWVANGELTPAGLTAYHTAAADWITGITGGNWAIRTLNSVSALTPITRVQSPALGDDAVVTTLVAHGLSGIVPVQIRGYRGSQNRLINGFWKLVVTGATTGYLKGSGKFAFNGGAGGILEKVDPVAYGIVGASDPVAGTRPVGNGAGRRRGRRSPLIQHV